MEPRVTVDQHDTVVLDAATGSTALPNPTGARDSGSPGPGPGSSGADAWAPPTRDAPTPGPAGAPTAGPGSAPTAGAGSAPTAGPGSAPTAGATSPTLGLSGTSAPGRTLTGATFADPELTASSAHPGPGHPVAPAPGWLAVREWRAGGFVHPTAWSQVPPFLPSAQPPVIVMRNNAAVVGATLGSVSLFLSLLPIIGIIAWLLAPIGLVSSLIGLLVGVSRRVGRVGALWGMLTSGLALVVCLAWTALLFAL